MYELAAQLVEWKVLKQFVTPGENLSGLAG
jgi:hypothetical protein